MLRDIVNLIFILSFPLCLFCKNITLTEEEPIFLTILNDILVNDVVTVCIDEENEGTLQAFYPSNLKSYQSHHYNLYDGDKISNNTAWLNGTPLIPFAATSSITSKSGCFTLLNTGDTKNYNVITFLWKEIQTKNCAYDNVATSPQDPPKYFKSTPNGTCEALLFESQSEPSGIFFDKIESFNNTMMFELKSTINGRSLMKINNNTWSNFGLYVDVITVILPPNSMIAFTIHPITQRSFNIRGEANTKGIIASPGYSGMKQETYPRPLYIISSSNKKNFYINFHIKIIEGQEEVVITSDTPGQSYTFTSNDTGKNGIIYGTTIQVINYEKDPITDYFLIEYEYLDGPNLPSTIPLIESTITAPMETPLIESTTTTTAMELTTNNKIFDLDVTTIPCTKVSFSTASTTTKNQKNHVSKIKLNISFIILVVRFLVFKF